MPREGSGHIADNAVENGPNAAHGAGGAVNVRHPPDDPLATNEEQAELTFVSMTGPQGRSCRQDGPSARAREGCRH